MTGHARVRNDDSGRLKFSYRQLANSNWQLAKNKPGASKDFNSCAKAKPDSTQFQRAKVPRENSLTQHDRYMHPRDPSTRSEALRFFDLAQDDRG
jgi:hypothetical protein